MYDTPSYERYSRQLILKGFGEAGQEKLSRAKVLVIGAGGLGCPVMLYLAAAGVGTIAVMDDDTVELNNLHRQPIYNMDDIGKLKTERAVTFLNKLNPDIHVHPFSQRLTPLIALEILNEFDIIIDCTDNFSSRYLINDASVILNKPLVYGAVSQYEGQLSVFNVQQKDIESVNYRDLFPEPPFDREVLSCAEAGVLGVVPGIIGSMQASETIKLITGIGRPLINRLYVYNALNNQGYEFIIQKRKGSRSFIPENQEAFRRTDYDGLCEKTDQRIEISAEEFETWIKSGSARVIDVREYGEEPAVSEFIHERIPLSQLSDKIIITGEEPILFFCQSGIRSTQAVQWMINKYGKAKKVYCLKGGILNYKNHLV